MEAFLSAKKLKIGYKGKSIHPAVSLNIYRGEFICLIGQNGCGKSTLIRSMGGLQPLTGGSVEINGTPLKKMTSNERARNISFVLTDSSAGNSLTVRQTVELGRLPYTNMFGTLKPIDKEICRSCMEQTKVWHLQDRFIGEISDGEKQRTFIAKALAQDTPLIFLDEPCAHLDLPNKIAITCLLRELSHNNNKAVLMSTHELDIALQAADKIWLMDKENLFRAVPEDMVLEGKISAAFNNGVCMFDDANGKFSINYQGDKKLYLRGKQDSLATIWTKHALERSGYKIDPEEELFGVEIDELPQWIMEKNGRKTKFQNIEDLLFGLKSPEV